MTQGDFDVVIVPDFGPRSADIFVARALFFLAAWDENAGSARGLPLHIACIGEPPLVIRSAAERYGARISVHEPLGITTATITQNKLRGLEIEPLTDQVLLVDVDVLALGDVGGLRELAGTLAAVPIGKPPLKMRYWRTIFGLVGLDVPEERISSMLGGLLDPAREHLRSAAQNEKLRNMVPMYNSGVVLAPRDCGLRTVWEQHTRTISTGFKPEEERWSWAARSNEVALATAVEALKRRGVAFQQLPAAYHTQWPEVWGRLRWGEPRLFHAMYFLRDRELALEPQGIARHIRDFCSRMRSRHLDGDNRFREVIYDDPESFTEFTNELEAELLRLLDDHVAPALERATKASQVL